MARKSAGDLVVQIQADAKGLNSVIDGAESRMLAFSNKIGQIFTPQNMMAGLGGLASGAAMGFMADIASHAKDFIGTITATGPKIEAMLHPVKSAEESMERLVELGKSSEDFGMGPQFIRGLQIAMGPEAEKMEKMLIKLLKLKSELGAGGSNEEFVRNIVKQGAAIQGAEDRIRFAAGKVGDKTAMGLVELFQGGTEGLDRALAKVEKLKLGTEANIAAAKAWKQELKDIMLLEQSAKENTLLSGGLMSMGAKQMWSGQLDKGALNIKEGFENLFTNSPTMTASQSKAFIARARDMLFELMDKAETPKAVRDIETLLDITNEFETNLRTRGGWTLDARNAEMIMRGVQIAQGKVPGKSGDVQPSDEWFRQMDVLRQINDQALILQLSYGKTAEEAAKIADQVNGLNAAQQEAAASGRAWKEAISIREANKTPMDKIAEDAATAKRLFESGTLSDADYRKALLRMQRNATGPAATPDREANTALVGSQEWAKAFSRANEPMEQKDEAALEEAAKQTQIQEDMRSELKRLNEKKAAVLQIPPGG